MDPRRMPPHYAQGQPMHSPSLVCVGGMLRVAASPQPPPANPMPDSTHSLPTTPSRTNVTPFKQLASPFTAAAPFTAPTTPYSTFTPSPIHPHLSPSLTPRMPAPVTPTCHAQPVVQAPDLQPQPQQHLLSQKQVRELRRLCRKTANRAEFENRLIQIRQVASISAMATSSLHLFDPGNPSSGFPLRMWVETHRAQGADWRDERPLSVEAAGELRRWDRLLKAWARVRFESQPGSEAHHVSQEARSVLADDAIMPVRLEFERISLGASPTTPAHNDKARNVYSTDFMRLASPVTPADAPAHNIANSPVASTNAPVVGTPTDATPSRSAWSKPPLAGLTRRVDARRPMSEVSINRVGNTINVTLPPSNTPTSSAGIENCGYARYIAREDQENAIPAAIRRGLPEHASKTAKSWRNALMGTEESKDADERVMAFRLAAKNLFADSAKAATVGEAATTPQERTDMDWGNLRRNEIGGSPAGQSVWQKRPDNT